MSIIIPKGTNKGKASKILIIPQLLSPKILIKEELAITKTKGKESSKISQER